MSHGSRVGVEVHGQPAEVCTIVPGNEDLADRVRLAERRGAAPPAPTKAEIDRAVRYHLEHHGHGGADQAPYEPEPPRLGWE